MAEQFVMCTRATSGGSFFAEPGPTRYLRVPDGETPAPRHGVPKVGWFRDLRAAAVWGHDSRRPDWERGDLLVFVHGFNTAPDEMMARHRRLDSDLKAAGFRGVILSFDWPSNNMALNYLEDRHDAKQTAMRLVSDGIRILSREQRPECTINTHLLGHSTGAYVIREAFDDADDARLANNSWYVSQVAFIGGDVSSASLAASNATSDSLFRHCTRLTNYSNGYDSVLKLSNAKRIGTAPRVGRVGLPPDAPEKSVNVDCSEYFAKLEGDPAVAAADQHERLGAFDHSWHIGNAVFARDLFETLRGDLVREVIPTRARAEDGSLKLVRQG